MFRSTYGYADVFSDDSQAMEPQWVHMALEEATGHRLFEVDEIHYKDCGSETIYLLDLGLLRVPFTTRMQADGAWIPLRRFEAEAGPYASHWPAGVGTLETEVSVHRIGQVLDASGLTIRRMESLDPWHGIPRQGMNFASDEERWQVARSIQKALPVLLSDQYFGIWSRPLLVRHVSCRDAAWQPFFDASGAVERSNVQWRARPEGRRRVNDSLERLEALAAGAPLRLETLKAEVLDLERDELFFVISHASTLTSHERFWTLLRGSFAAHYADRFDSFERFLVWVLDQASDRRFGRSVVGKYSVAPRTPTHR